MNAARLRARFPLLLILQHTEEETRRSNVPFTYVDSAEQLRHLLFMRNGAHDVRATKERDIDTLLRSPTASYLCLLRTPGMATPRAVCSKYYKGMTKNLQPRAVPVY